MRVPDHQPDGTELEARRPVPPRNVSIRHPVGHSGRSTGAAGMPRLRRQQGAVVRDHRRSAAITIMGNTTPPRDPNDENDEEDEDEDDKDGDEDDDDERQGEPAVVREPDE